MKNVSVLPGGYQVDRLDVFNSIVEGSGDSFSVKDLSGRYVLINEVGAGLVNRPASEIIGMTDFDLFDTETAAKIAETDRIALDRAASMTYETTGTVGGVTRTLSITKGPYRDAAGNLRGLYVIARDITEQKRMADQRIDHEKRFRALVEKSTDGVTLLDQTGKILYASPSSSRLTGFDAGELHGLDVFTMIHPDDLAHTNEALAGLLQKHGAVTTVHFRFRHKEGSWKWMEGTGTNLLNDPGIGAIVGNYRDITERKLLEKDLRGTYKMEGAGRLQGGVAAEFNGALTIIIGYCDLISGGRYHSQDLAKDIDKVGRAAARAAMLTDQLLESAERPPSRTDVVNVNQTLMRFDRMLRPLLGKDVQILFRLTRQPTWAKVGEGCLEQILANLAANARDAMVEGGQLTIETSLTQLEGTPDGTRHMVRAGPYVSMTVTDTGCGMPPDVLSHLFEPFFTTKPANKNAGLGLSRVYNMVLQSGGDIQVRSQPDSGTTFTVYLPRVDDPVEELPDIRKTSAGGYETVLLVEDEPLLRALANDFLTSQGYFVVEARDCEHAIELCRLHGQKIHLLLTDMMMPQMSGTELAERARALWPELKVLFMTGYPEIDVPASTSLLPKPFTAVELAQKVRAVLESGSDMVRA